MKRVVIVLNTSWNIYNFRLNLMKSLRDKGFKVIALAPKDDYSEKLKDEGFEWVDLPLENDGTNPIKELLQIIRFYKIYKQINPDIVLHYTIKPNIYGTLAAKCLNIPVINNVSGLGTIFLNESLSAKVAKLLYRVSFRFADAVFFQNEDDQRVFIDNKLVKSNQSQVIPGSGIDSSRFAPLEVQKDDSTQTVFLMIARLIKEKGIVEYIEAIKMLKVQYPKVRFQLIGSLYLENPSAISEALLQRWIGERLIEYICFSDNMEEVIAGVDCVVLPSYREGLSRVLLEAASMAKPIVTTNVAGCKDVVDDGINGFLCNVKDANSLAKQMEKMILMSEEDRKRMGEKGREIIIFFFILLSGQFLCC
ncbi:MAG: glycosyltransferase family 4 protein [Epsilonproteobacteria bacterium]|nr:glycosyltransferase family 4 protein [Campylobacterota bacterium]